MDLKDVKHLAMLARLDLPEEEEEALLADLTSILGYINQINEVNVDLAENTAGPLHNVMRDDVVTTITGSYTEVLLASAPESKDGFVKVKKIL